jgi:hypothetical protein
VIQTSALARVSRGTAILVAVAVLNGCSSSGGGQSLTDTFMSKAAAADFQAAGSIAGTISMSMGGQSFDGTYTGTFSVKGKDSSTSMTTTIAGGTSVSDQVSVGDSDYSRSDDGQWTKTPRSDQGLSVPAMLAGGVTDKGAETHNGQQLHRLELNKTPAARDVFSDPNMANGNFSVIFWAKDDGTPAGMTISGSWSQDINGAQATATLNMDFTFEKLSGVTVEAPSM